DLTQYLRFRAVTVEPANNAAETSCNKEHFNSSSKYVFGSNNGFVPMNDETSTPNSQHLAAQASETIAYCFEVQFDPEAPNATQQLTADYTWRFHAQSVTQ